MGFFSERGAEILRKVYNDTKLINPSPFHEASTFEQASFVDIIQETINQGHRVSGLEVSTGWIEIHQRIDVNRAEEELDIIRPNRI
jgi:hypothetical protein